MLYDFERSTTVTEPEHILELTIAGELWGVYCDTVGENWPRYNGTTLYSWKQSLKPIQNEPGAIPWRRECYQTKALNLYQHIEG